MLSAGMADPQADIPGPQAADVLAADVQASGPVFTISGPETIAEGQTYVLQLASSQLAMGEEVVSWTINWGDGVSDIVDGDAQTATHVYDDGPFRVSSISAVVQTTLGSYGPFVQYGSVTPFGTDSTFNDSPSAGAGIFAPTSDSKPRVHTLPDGKYLVASDDPDHEFRLTRFLSNGDLDLSFGVGGRVVTNFATASRGRPHAIAVQSDGKILIAGTVEQPAWIGALARYLPNGSPDLTFGTSGQVLAPISAINDMAIRADGKIVVTGSQLSQFAVTQFNTDGTLDTTFGVRQAAVGGYQSVANAMAIAENGDIVLVGYSQDTSGGIRQAAVVRYTAAGALDLNFNQTGIVKLPLTTRSYLTTVQLQDDGKIVVAGITQPSSEDWLVARLRSDGQLDTSFSGDGLLTRDFSGANDSLSDMKLQSDGSIILAGGAFVPPNGHELVLARYNSDGTPDLNFDGDGIYIAPSRPEIFESIRSIDIGGGKLIALGGFANTFRLFRYNLANRDIQITSAPPTAVFSSNGPVNPGSVVTLSFANVSDPSSADAAMGFVYSYDYGLDEEFTLDSSLRVPPSSMNQPGEYVVRGRIWDKDGDYSEYTTTVTVGHVNTAPVAGEDAYVATSGQTLVVSPGAPVTSISMSSDAGDWVGGGETYAWTDDDGTFTAQRNFDNGVSIVFNGPEYWTFNFAAAGDATIQPGFYGPALRFPFQSLNHGLAVTGDGRGSNTLVGNFSVRDVRYAPNGAVLAFAAAFEQHSEGAIPGLFGVIRYNDVAPGGVLANDSDRDFQKVSAVLVSGPSHGSLSLNTDGTFSYTPDLGFTGEDLFQYRATDGELFSDVVAVSIHVVPDIAPVVSVDSVTTSDNSPALSGAVDDPAATIAVTVAGSTFAGVNHGDGTWSLEAGIVGPLALGLHDVQVTATDSASNIGLAAGTLSIINANPTATLVAPDAVVEGDSASVSLINPFDGPADTAAGFTYSFDFDNDDTFEIADSASNTADIPAALLADGDSQFTLRARIADQHGGFSDYTRTVTVANAKPIITVVGEVSVVAGEVYALTFAAQDPGQDTISQWSIDWGDGVVDTLDGSAIGAEHVYLQQALGRAITVTAVQEDGPTTVDGPVVDVLPLVPVLAALQSDPAAIDYGQSVTLTATGAQAPLGRAIESVEFYVDINGDGLLSTDLDQLLGSDSDGSDGWTWTGDTVGLVTGALTMLARAGDGQAWSEAVAATVQVQPPPPVLAYQQSSAANGLVVLEAETYDGVTVVGDKTWSARSYSGASGSAIQALTNTGANITTDYVTRSPRVDYVIHFNRPGVHYVWLRSTAPSSYDDVVHVGLDGQAVATADKVSLRVNSALAWRRNTLDGPVATVVVDSPGIHTLNLWMGEDGAIVDRLLLTTDSAYNPGSSTGPATSARGLVSVAPAPEIALSGNGRDIAHADTTPTSLDHTDFGTVMEAATPLLRTFTVTNNGLATLSLGQLVLPQGFTLVDGLPNLLSPGASDTFTVQLDTDTPGVKSGVVSLTSNDSDENPFRFTITGRVRSLIPETEAPAYVQSSAANGLIVLEPEINDGLASVGDKSWVERTYSGASGSAMQALPNTGANILSSNVAASPRIDLNVYFNRTGVHYVWLRGTAANSNDDSVHVGLDGQALTSADNMKLRVNTALAWGRTTFDNAVATIHVTTPGFHTLNLWMRKDGAIIDRVLLTSDVNYTPTNSGPATSARQTVPTGAGLSLAAALWLADGGAANAMADSVTLLEQRADDMPADDAAWVAAVLMGRYRLSPPPSSDTWLAPAV